MSELAPSIAADVAAACGAAADEAAGALGRALDGQFTLGSPQTGHYAAETPPSGFEGPGLAVLLTFGQTGLVIALPESSGLLPAWYAAPDATGESKLSTLAQELSMLLVPETLAADKFEAQRVDSLQSALVRGGIASESALVTLDVTGGDKTTTLSVVWPLTTPESLFAVRGADTATESAPHGVAPTRVEDSKPATSTKSRLADFSRLPSYSRSLLRIRIPVSVHLANKKEVVQEVVGLVPGTIIKFEKGCDELLHMVIGGQAVAEGEAVKIGDKFGFRVTGMLLPQEQFIPLRGKRTA